MQENTPRLLMEAQDIFKVFPGTTALQNVDFKIYGGRINVLVGENGAGKSTLMKILSGSYPHNTYDGEIIINGEEWLICDPTYILADIGYIIPDYATILPKLIHIN